MVLVILTTPALYGQFKPLGLWQSRSPFLKFITTAQNVFVSNCSAVVTVQSTKSNGVATNVVSDLVVNLSSTGLTFYSDSNCTNVITSVTILATRSSANFYFVVASVSSPVITVTAPAYKFGTQAATATTNPYVWTGGGANSNWSTALNWSGGVAPGSSNQAIFDGTCTINCSPTFSASMSIAGVRMLSGYTGTITQNTGLSITVGSSGWYQEAGAFVGSNSAVTVNGSFSLLGGAYTASSATTTVNASMTISGSPTFNAGSSTMLFNNRGSISVGSASFNNVSLDPGNGGTYTIIGTWLINGLLTLRNTTNNTTLSGGIIDSKGDITVSNYGMPGTTLIKMTGSSQTLNATAATTSPGSRNFPALEIASSGTVNLSGYIGLTSHYTFTSATVFNAGTSTINFIPSGSTTGSMGNVDYYNIGYYSGSSSTLASNLTVVLNGSSGAGQAVDNSAAPSTSAFTPHIEINSTAGTVSFPSTFIFKNNLIYTQGTVIWPTTSLFAGYAGSSNVINIGAQELNNVTMAGANGNNYAITGTLKVNGDLSYSATGSSILTGDISLKGNLSYTDFYSADNTLTFTGTANQTISNPSEFTSAIIKNSITVDKSSGTLTLLNNIKFNNSISSFTILNGSLNMNGKNFTVNNIPSLNGATITKNAGILTVGSTVVGTGSLYGGTIAP